MTAHRHSATSTTPRVVIVGGGAGGLELAARLGRRHGPQAVTLIDSLPYHIWKPSLHEVAAGTLDIHQEGLSYLVLAHICHFSFILGPMLDIDRERTVLKIGAIAGPGNRELIPPREVPYDILVMAIGSKANFFGTPGAQEHAVTLDNVEAAEAFRLQILEAMLRVDQAKATDPEARLHLVIVGGGATGVELAVELREASHVVSAYSLSAFNPRLDLAITLIEGAPRILAALPERISKAAQDRLESLDIRVETGCAVASVTEDHVRTRDGRRFHADMCLWAAGISAPDLLQKLELPLHRNGQVMVDEQLRTPDPDIYAMGDCAAAPWTEGRLVPARAQAAHQQASYLARQLGARLKGEAPEDKPYVYEDHGSLVSLGQDAGVGSLMGKLTGRGLFLSGMLARMMYMSLHLMHHRAILGVSRTASLALARLLVRRTHSRVKLH